MSQINMNFETRLQPENDTVSNLWDLVDLYDRRLIIPPLHQRDAKAWDKNKRHEWIRRIANINLKPVGVIVTYQLSDGKQSPVYLNDGLQRIATTSEYKNFSEEIYGDTTAHAEEVIRCVNMPRQHRHYKSHDEALLDFQRLNFGTPLTPFEYFAGILRYLDGYESEWRPLLEDVHKKVNDNAARVIAKLRGGKQQKHNYYRSDYGLFYRFISGDTSVSAYKTASQRVKPDDIYKGECIEAKLKTSMLEIGLEGVRKKVKVFGGLVERETAMIETFWAKTAKGRYKGAGIMINLYRHLIDVAIWRRNLQVPTHVWHEYTRKLLDVSQGAASVINPEDNRERSPIALNDLQKLSKICRIIESDFYEQCKKKRAALKKEKQTKPGYDNSHLLPLGIGEEAVPEPASINRARGPRPMTERELQILK